MKFLLPTVKAVLLLFTLLAVQFAIGQGTPEILYYKFNGTGTTVPNLASSPPSGASTASIVGSQTQGGTGTCGTNALVGTGSSSTSDYVNTGWTTSLTGSWTISFYTNNIPSTTSTYYIFGDLSAGSFRCFTGGVAGAGNWILRGPLTDVTLTGGASTSAAVSTFVYDSTAGKIYAYLNGSLINTVNQSAITLSGSGPFKVGGYSSSNGLPSGSYMDEFRFYHKALTATEVAQLVYGSPTTSTISPLVQCGGNYKSPSGRYLWSTSGSYKDTITNTLNCDSIITINLTVKQPTKSTITTTVCNSYYSPAGNIYTTSGTYKDIIPNAVGCDSVITINLTVNYSSTSTISPVTCNSYTSPAGKVWTTSGNYTDTIPNAAGCDSIITINLTVNYSSTSTISPIVCNSYTSPSGKNMWTTSGTYTDTIPNANGCDSVITINLTVNHSSTNTISLTTCNNYTSPSGKLTWTSSGIYTDTIPNNAGCDSIITINLTINQSTTSSINPIVCNSYISPSGVVYTISGTYQDTIPNTAGCDSIITINLVVNNSSTSTISPSACFSYTSPSGNYVWTAGGTYTDTIPNTTGCDSVITINLTVNTVDASVSQPSMFIISANAVGASYQWLDCANNYLPIAGETNQSFTVTANGDYAVEVTENSCVDTSNCISITNVGIPNVSAGNTMALYPNPSNGQVTIALSQALQNAIIRIVNITGQTVAEKTNLNGTAVNFDISGETPGIYFVEVEEKGTVSRIKMVKF
jgi:hypothetical protein